MAEKATETAPTPIPYSERDDWKDVKPVEQTDLPQPLVPIYYPPECKRVTLNLRNPDVVSLILLIYIMT
jgi:hypothetical protein